jgi:biotin carboxyl carrier protein
MAIQKTTQEQNLSNQNPMHSKWSNQHIIVATAIATIMLSAVATAVALNAKLIQTHGLDVWNGRFAPYTLTLPLSALVLSSVAAVLLVAKIKNQALKETQDADVEPKKASTHPKSFATTLSSEGERYEGLSLLKEGQKFRANETLFYKEAMKMKTAFLPCYSGVIKKVHADDGLIPPGKPVVDFSYNREQKELALTTGTVRYVSDFKKEGSFKKGEVYGHIVSSQGQELPLKVEWPIQVGTIHALEGSEVKKDQTLFDFSFLSF